MGAMICNVHGRVGFAVACSPIAKEVELGTMPDGHKLNILGNVFVCDDCFRSLGFEKFAGLAELPLQDQVHVEDGRWELFETALKAIEGAGSRQFCLECLAELESRSRTAAPIPNPEDHKRF